MSLQEVLIDPGDAEIVAIAKGDEEIAILRGGKRWLNGRWLIDFLWREGQRLLSPGMTTVMRDKERGGIVM